MRNERITEMCPQGFISGERHKFSVVDEVLRPVPFIDGLWCHIKTHRGKFRKTWICSPLYVEAVTHDAHGNNFGRLLRFKTEEGAWRKWDMPMRLLAGGPAKMVAALRDMGLEVSWLSGTHILLAELVSHSDGLPHRIREARQ